MDLLVKIGIGTIFFIFILFIIGLIIYFAQPKTPLKQSPALIPAKTLITIPTSKVSTAIPTPINIPIITGSVTLKADNNKYCTDAGDKIICSKENLLGSWERFIIETIETPDNNYIALRGGKDGKYCSDEGDRIICNRDIIGGWEKFKIMNLSKDQTADNNYVAIMGGYDGRYCTIKDGPMVCTSTVITDFEKFKIDNSL